MNYDPQTVSALTEPEIVLRLAEGIRSPASLDPAFSVQFPPGYHRAPPRPAAVLVPFLYTEGEWHLLFTRRTDTLPEHSGQVAFPGGRSDPEDPSQEATALREAFEEIGLRPENVRLLGKLEAFTTITNYRLTPVVGRIIDWPCALALAEVEVKRVFTIPLAWLIDPAHHEVRFRALPFPHADLPVIYFQTYDGELLWGVSAQITLSLLQALHLLRTK
jgi:8-oxo-dGTP pyrophosphatase MutT (NUDIX family)